MRYFKERHVAPSPREENLENRNTCLDAALEEEMVLQQLKVRAPKKIPKSHASPGESVHLCSGHCPSSLPNRPQSTLTSLLASPQLLPWPKPPTAPTWTNVTASHWMSFLTLRPASRSESQGETSDNQKGGQRLLGRRQLTEA